MPVAVLLPLDTWWQNFYVIVGTAAATLTGLMFVCAWAQTYYQHHRQKDRSHANAPRRLGHRWRKIIHKMWMDRTLYDPELHHRNQLQHGSWIFQLKEC